MKIDEKYFRPTEVDYLLGDPSKAKQTLGWEATAQWDTLARLMVDADIDQLADELNGTRARRNLVLAASY